MSTGFGRRNSRPSCRSSALCTPDEPVASLIDEIRGVFDSGRIGTFYGMHDLQPGTDWDHALRDKAATSAVLAVRTDLYSSRGWCQREVLTVKIHGMPSSTAAMSAVDVS